MFDLFAPKISAPHGGVAIPQGPSFCLLLDIYSQVIKMLYLIGLGLSDETDITVKGLEIVKKAARVYLENYTAVLLCDVKTLVRSFYIPHFKFHEDVI